MRAGARRHDGMVMSEYQRHAHQVLLLFRLMKAPCAALLPLARDIEHHENQKHHQGQNIDGAVNEELHNGIHPSLPTS